MVCCCRLQSRNPNITQPKLCLFLKSFVRNSENWIKLNRHDCLKPCFALSSLNQFVVDFVYSTLLNFVFHLLFMKFITQDLILINSMQPLAVGVCHTCNHTCDIHTAPPSGRIALAYANGVLSSCLEPTQAPSRVRARGVSASEIQVHWEPLPSGSGSGKILAYEVRTKTKELIYCPTKNERKLQRWGKLEILANVKRWGVVYLRVRLEGALLPPIVPD